MVAGDWLIDDYLTCRWGATCGQLIEHNQQKRERKTMTTNVYDKVAGMLTTDSRWSMLSGDWLAFVDDTGYDKLAYTAKVGFLFAGQLSLISEWKAYVAGGMKKGTRPSITQAMWEEGRISIIQVELATGKLDFQSHKHINSSFGAAVRAVYAGSGAIYAKECWDCNKCAITAIRSAALKDRESGGEVVFLNRKNRANNVRGEVSAVAVGDQFNDKGYIMNTTNEDSMVLVRDAANDHSRPDAQAAAKAFLSNPAASLCAPFPGMGEPWTQEKIAELDAALSKYEED